MDDVHRLAALPGLSALGELLRSRLEVWCGLLSASGGVIPLGAGRGGGGCEMCDSFMKRRDGQGSCAGSVRRWLGDARSGGIPANQVTAVVCHAGLTGLIWPIVLGEAFVCAVYVTGYWRREDVDAQRIKAVKRLNALHLPGMAELGECPVLTEVDETWCVEILGQMARDVEQFLREGEASLPERPSLFSGARTRYSEIKGESLVMRRLFDTLDKVSGSDSTVLIQGENGTGKELIARAIHYTSRRSGDAFVAQNCSALNDNVLDSELFGHRRGSFTGAVSDKPGLFEVADGGTFFLDEVGDMTASLQVKLLRVLQEGTFLPVGDTVTRRVDVRIIAATNRDLRRMVLAGTFREDLFYRLNVINLVAPALRERVDDIPLLAEYFITRASRDLGRGTKRLSAEALSKFMGYRWPGNVRELENEVERLVVLSGVADSIDAELLSPQIRASAGVPILKESVSLKSAVEALERRMLLEGLRRHRWNKTRTAEALGISRRNLIRKVSLYELEALRE